MAKTSRKSRDDGERKKKKKKKRTRSNERRERARKDPEPASEESGELDAKAKLAAAKLFRRLRKSVSREGREAPVCDEEVLPLLVRVGEQAVEVMGDALADKRWEARWAAAVGLRYLHQKAVDTSAAVPALIAQVKDDDSQVRYAVVEALGRQKDQFREVMPALLKALGDRNAEVSRAAVAQVLELSPSRRALTRTMIKLLEGRRSQLAKIGAMMVLFHLGKAAKEAVPVLLPFLDDESAEIREYAHLALMGIRTPSMRLQIIRTASMRLQVQEEGEPAPPSDEGSGDLTEEELDELSDLGDVTSEVASEAELEELEERKKPRAPRRRRRGLAARRRRF